MAQDEDLRSGNVRPRTALMSAEVARQKLVTFGLEEISALQELGERYTAKARHEGRTIAIEIDRRSGVVREIGRPLALTPDAKRPVPMVRDATLKIRREDIARARVVIESLPEERNEIVRPLGDRPVKEAPPERERVP